MNCRAISAKLSAYIDGELPGTDMLAVRSHLGRCPECGTEERELRACKRTLGRMAPVAPPPDLEDRLLRAVRTRTVRHNLWRGLRYAPLSAALAAAGTFALVAIINSRSEVVVREPALASQPFELTRDQAYVAGADPLSYGPVALPASYAKR